MSTIYKIRNLKANIKMQNTFHSEDGLIGHNVAISVVSSPVKTCQTKALSFTTDLVSNWQSSPLFGEPFDRIPSDSPHNIMLISELPLTVDEPQKSCCVVNKGNAE